MSAYVKHETAWCPGCGNFAILDTLKTVLEDIGKRPREVLLVGGIGQAAKLPQYLNTNSFCGLHGRALPAAVAAKMANESLTVIVTTGDGDSYGEGGNHFLHNIRRNVDITHFVHNNQIYGLTKGQPSPTSDTCTPENQAAGCNKNIPINPLLVALAAGAMFVARGYSGDPEQLSRLMKRAIAHEGYALVDILQPCVSFNKKNTYAYFKEHVYSLDESYDAQNKLEAMELLMRDDGRIPTGVFYEEKAPTFHQKHPVLSKGGALIDRDFDMGIIETLVKGFV